MTMTEKQAAGLIKARAARAANVAARKAQGIPEPRRKRKVKTETAPAPALKKLSEFAGITNEDCPVECTVKRCVITGKDYCGHPRKSGIQAVDKANPTVVDRYNRARKQLLHAELDRRP